MAPTRTIAGKVAIGAMALVAAVTVGRISLATALARKNFSSALSLKRDQPDALSGAAYAAITQQPNARGARRAVVQATAALRRDPTNAAAAAYLALAEEIRGDRLKALGLMRYSQRLSRRNLVAQLWLIEYAVSQGQIAGALSHYDTALRVSPVAPGMLFPVLVSATSDPGILAPLARVLARRPDWAEQYVQQLVQSGTDLDNIARLLAMMRAQGSPVPDRALATLVDRLVDASQFDGAWRLYAAYRPDARRASIRNPEFATVLTSPTAFDWTLPEQDTVSADIREGALHFDSAPAAGGVVARQLLNLTPGEHVIDGEAANIPALGDSAPYLTLECRPGGAELQRLVLVAPGDRPARFSWTVRIPASCAVQSLALTLQPVDAPGGLSGEITRLALKR